MPLVTPKRILLIMGSSSLLARIDLLIALFCLTSLAHSPTAIETHTIDISRAATQPVMGQLKMGGANPAGVRIEANNQYLTLDDKPWTPVVGEMHYSRTDPAQWGDDLEKMKAGGISLVSCYVIWIHHEEVQGQFDFAGSKDLRKFVQACNAHGLKVWLRIGPWAHGEVRNGGIPDWVMQKCGKAIRTSDPTFMGFTRLLYRQVSQQVQGLLWKDGGPIVGIQVDNEMRNNPNYLVALKALAKDVGLDAPLYSMTGWDGARATPGELLMMYGGYPDGFWMDKEKGIAKAGRKNYFFLPTRDDSTIAQDLQTGPRALDAGYRSTYPYLCCEIGGGMAISYLRRPLIAPDDVVAEAICKLGSGANMLGYYMYHGGVNPAGKLSTLQESQETDYPNDMPVMNYDFQAPIGAFGEIHPVYNPLRRLHLFINDFGPLLATMPAVFPGDGPKSMDDVSALRYCVRTDGKSGFIFINNYERGAKLAEHSNVIVNPASSSTAINVASGDYQILPFNLDMNGITLKSTNAQLLCKLHRADADTFVFFMSGSEQPSFRFPPSDQIEITGAMSASGSDGMLQKDIQAAPKLNSEFIARRGASTVKILVIDNESSLHACKATSPSGDSLIISQANLTFSNGKINLSTIESADMNVKIYPHPTGASDGGALTSIDDWSFANYAIAATPAPDVSVKIEQTKPPGEAPAITIGKRNKPEPPSDDAFNAAAGVWHLTLPANALDNVANLWLHIHYTGNIARLYIGDKLIDDDFYFGKPMDISVNRFAPEILTQGLTLKVLPLRKDFPVYIQEDRMPAFGGNGQAVGLEKVTATPEYHATMKLP